jgi:hypothetical protein
MNTTSQQQPVFGRTSLQELLQHRANGFQFTKGFHIYCELRPTSKLELAETDAAALKYIRVIEEFVNYGVDAASPFKMALLELQENVLHFYKEAELTIDSAIEAIQFVYVFTTTLYEELKPDLEEGWEGFASCMDHGPAILIRHQSLGNSSTVSLGPCANRPAKQLLYGKTPAGCVDIPSSWAKLLGVFAQGNWFTIDLRDRQKMPFGNRMENLVLRNQLIERIRAFRRDKNRQRVSAILASNKIIGSGIQADLDGFSSIIKQSFDTGRADAIESVAMGFAQVLEFGDYMRNSTPGSYGLPWAGDRAPTIVPKNVWLDFAMRWQNFAGETSEGKKRGWGNLFKNVGWAIGGCHGATGTNIICSIGAQGRSFVIATGWPMVVSLDAQNLGKSGDIITHNLDYAQLDSATKRLFSKVDTDFWKTTALTSEKIKSSAIELGKAKPVEATHYSSQYSSITVPPSKPHHK